MAEVWASLRTDGPNANAWWGRGIYSVPRPPDLWKDGYELLDNNFRNMMARDKETKGPEYVEKEYPPRAAFCVPILINPEDAFDVAVRATPEMVEAGKPPGTNLAGKLLNEPGMPPRTCVVLRTGEGGVENARGQLLSVLRTRADQSSKLEDRLRLGDVLRDRGFHKEAFPIHKDVYHRSKSQFGFESQMCLKAANALAHTFFCMGNCTEAAGLLRSVLEVQERTLGSEHPSTLASMNNLAPVLLSMGNCTEAAGLLRSVLEVGERTEHPDTLASMNNLASALRRMGNYA